MTLEFRWAACGRGLGARGPTLLRELASLVVLLGSAGLLGGCGAFPLPRPVGGQTLLGAGRLGRVRLFTDIEQIRGATRTADSNQNAPSDLASAALYAQTFGDHPYGSEQEGTTESVQALNQRRQRNLILNHREAFSGFFYRQIRSWQNDRLTFTERIRLNRDRCLSDAQC